MGYTQKIKRVHKSKFITLRQIIILNKLLEIYRLILYHFLYNFDTFDNIGEIDTSPRKPKIQPRPSKRLNKDLEMFEPQKTQTNLGLPSVTRFDSPSISDMHQYGLKRKAKKMVSNDKIIQDFIFSFTRIIYSNSMLLNLNGYLGTTEVSTQSEDIQPISL